MNPIKAIEFFQMIEKFNDVKRIGLDFHGVIDKYPEELRNLFVTLRNMGKEVYVIIGNKINPEFLADLDHCKISHNGIFSIIGYHESIGTPIRYDERGHPWIEEELWNSTKALLCEQHNIDIHIDDSTIYGCYFKRKNRYFLLKEDGYVYPDSELNMVWVNQDLLHEDVVCVHTTREGVCEKCEAIGERDGGQDLAGEWFEIRDP